jgi:hypothetical protein
MDGAKCVLKKPKKREQREKKGKERAKKVKGRGWHFGIRKRTVALPWER